MNWKIIKQNTEFISNIRLLTDYGFKIHYLFSFNTITGKAIGETEVMFDMPEHLKN